MIWDIGTMLAIAFIILLVKVLYALAQHFFNKSSKKKKTDKKN